MYFGHMFGQTIQMMDLGWVYIALILAVEM